MMKNKVNIFEELNKMKNLIHVKSGVVISEQADNITKDIDIVRNQLVTNTGFLNNVDEQQVVNILKKYATDKNTFQNFLDKYKEKYKVNVTDVMGSSFSGSDQEEIDDLNSVISKIGLRFRVSNGIAKFEDLAQLRQKNINHYYCSLKDGKITLPGTAFDGDEWKVYANQYKITEAEIAAAKATCPTVVVPPVDGTPAPASGADAGAAAGAAAGTNTPAPAAGPTPTQRFATTATSLGIQNPKMDVATLQTILNTLNQGGSGLTESKNLVNEELNKMKYIFGYQRGRVISEQDAAQTQQSQPAATQPAATQQAATQQAATQQAATQQAATQQATPKDLIRQIQTVLKTKYNANLGKFGAKGDGIDEKWGNLTQTALENAMKSIADVKQRRETETQQTTTQDTAIQQAAETGRMEIPQTNNLPNLPGIQLGNQQKQDIYTTLVNNKTLLTRNQNTVIYNGPDLSSAQRNELEQSMSQKGYRISKDNRDFRSGDKIIFKKN
jgi:hypothetical protein